MPMTPSPRRHHDHVHRGQSTVENLSIEGSMLLWIVALNQTLDPEVPSRWREVLVRSAIPLLGLRTALHIAFNSKTSPRFLLRRNGEVIDSETCRNAMELFQAREDIIVYESTLRGGRHFYSMTLLKHIPVEHVRGIDTRCISASLSDIDILSINMKLFGQRRKLSTVLTQEQEQLLEAKYASDKSKVIGEIMRTTTLTVQDWLDIVPPLKVKNFDESGFLENNGTDVRTISCSYREIPDPEPRMPMEVFHPPIPDPDPDLSCNSSRGFLDTDSFPPIAVASATIHHHPSSGALAAPLTSSEQCQQPPGGGALDGSYPEELVLPTEDTPLVGGAFEHFLSD